LIEPGSSAFSHPRPPPLESSDEAVTRRLHVTVLGARLLLDQAQAQINWAASAIAEVEQWTDTRAPSDSEHLTHLLEETLAQPLGP
jgi:hypothetical protein